MGIVSENEVVKAGAGRIVDPSEIDPGSVFAPPPTLGQRAKSIGKTVAHYGVGVGLPVAAGTAAGYALGPEASEPVAAGVRTAGQAIAGAAIPYAEYGISRLFGEPAQAPTARDVASSAIWNAAGAAIGEGGAAAMRWGEAQDALRGAASAEVAKLPPEQRTAANVRQIRKGLATKGAQDLRNRDFWKALGLNDQQIDEAVAAPPDVQAARATSLKRAERTVAAYQTIKDETGKALKGRYENILGNLPNEPTDVSAPAKLMSDWASGPGERELTPSFAAYLRRSGQELATAGGRQIDQMSDLDAVAAVYGSKEAARVSKFSADTQAAHGRAARGQLQQQAEYAKKVGGTPIVSQQTKQFGVREIRDIRTELRENFPRSHTPLDEKAYKQVKDSLDAAEAAALDKAGATPEQKGALKALDQEWGRWQETIHDLDPRQEKFGKEVADKLFDPMAKSPGTAMNFIHYAEEVERVKPGVMGDLKSAFLDKAMAEARQPGQPFQEMKLLRKLQDQWGGDKEARAVMGAMFGKDSPLADPATFTQLVGAASDPDAVAVKAAQGAGRSILASKYMQGMILYGLAATAVTGGPKGGFFMALTGQKGGEAQALAIASMLAGPPLMNYVVRSGNSPLQKAMVSYMTSPNRANMIRYAGELGGSTTAYLTSAAPASRPALGSPSPASTP